MARTVTAAVVLRGDGVLVARRAPGQSNAGKWEFPGGKLEVGEDERSCLAREMREELGVEGTAGAHVADSLYAYDRGEILLRAYLFTINAGDIALRVHDRVQWVGVEEIEKLDMTPADIPIAHCVRSYMEDMRDE